MLTLMSSHYQAIIHGYFTLLILSFKLMPLAVMIGALLGRSPHDEGI